MMNSHFCELYRKMFLIRACEEAIREHYKEDEMRTPMHMSMGSEAIAVGVCAALQPDDQVLTSYRSHAVYLAKTEDVEGFFLELYGKVGGPNEGRAGSMHLCNPSKGHMVASAVVGSQLPMALGMAWASKYQKKDRVVAVFFGDGALDEGVFWESLNIACLWHLPIVFVLEDNDLAVETPIKNRWGFDVTKLGYLFNLAYVSISTDAAADVTRVYDYAKIARSQVSHCPVLLHIPYRRWLEHVGVGVSPDGAFQTKDPLGYKWLYLDSLDTAEAEKSIRERVENAIVAARAALYPKVEELTHGVSHG